MSGKHSTDRSLAEQGTTSELGVRNTPREKGYHEAHDSMSNNREPARTEFQVLTPIGARCGLRTFPINTHSPVLEKRNAFQATFNHVPRKFWGIFGSSYRGTNTSTKLT